MKNVLALTYWSFKEPLTQSAALPYLKIISKELPENSRIFLLTLEKKSFSMTKAEKRKVTEELASHKITLIRKRYHRFGFMALLSYPITLTHLIFLCFNNKIQFIHCFCSPAGVLGYILSRITGKKLILDSYEPHAESMVENGSWQLKGLSYKILFYFEKKQTSKATAVIALSEGMKKYSLQKYGLVPKEFYFKSTAVDLSTFKPRSQMENRILRERLSIQKDILCIYVGKFGGIYLKDETFQLFKTASTHWGDAFKIILITDISRRQVEELANKYSLNCANIISFPGPLSQKEVIDYLSISDFAINPVKPVPSKRYCSPIKDGEYWAMGLPVILPDNIGDDSDIIRRNGIGAVLSELDSNEYSNAILTIDTLIHPPEKEMIKEKIISIARKYRDIKNTETIYRSIYQ